MTCVEHTHQHTEQCYQAGRRAGLAEHTSAKCGENCRLGWAVHAEHVDNTGRIIAHAQGDAFFAHQRITAVELLLAEPYDRLEVEQPDGTVEQVDVVTVEAVRRALRGTALHVEEPPC